MTAKSPLEIFLTHVHDANFNAILSLGFLIRYHGLPITNITIKEKS